MMMIMITFVWKMYKICIGTTYPSCIVIPKQREEAFPSKVHDRCIKIRKMYFYLSGVDYIVHKMDRCSSYGK